MLELSGIRIRLRQLDGTDGCELGMLRRAAAKKLRVPGRELASLERRRRSIDARKKNDIVLTFTLRVRVVSGAARTPSAKRWPGSPPRTRRRA